MLTVEAFFEELSGLWPHMPGSRPCLRLIGSTALFLQTTYERATTDSDILETSALASDVQVQLLKLAGANTRLAKRHHMHLQIVAEAIPFLPQQPRWHDPLMNLAHFDVLVLDIVDVVVSKLKRYDARDVSDIAAMIDRGHVTQQALVERFELAKDAWFGDSREVDLLRYIENLHAVERDLLDAAETAIWLPDRLLD